MYRSAPMSNLLAECAGTVAGGKGARSSRHGQGRSGERPGCYVAGVAGGLVERAPKPLDGRDRVTVAGRWGRRSARLSVMTVVVEQHPKRCRTAISWVPAPFWSGGCSGATAGPNAM